MKAAIYARVSTDRQEKNQTIDSQLSLLTTWAKNNKYELLQSHIYKDEACSGSRLDRPGLDALRDAAQDGEFDVLAVLCPDRLARKYAYQVLLLEELRKVGCEVIFLHHPISQDPNDQLLLQIQGAIAEYERAVLGERFRRGKLQKARSGQYSCTRPPYGYHYITKKENLQSQLVINEPEAEMIRTMYRWLVEENMTIRQIIKRLNDRQYKPRCGRNHWSLSTVRRILKDPIYMGKAYANRYKGVTPKKPRSRTSRSLTYKLKAREEWIEIAVPPIVSQEFFEKAEVQLERNSLLSYRNNKKHNYLLRCLLTCKVCGLSMFGIARKVGTPSQCHYYVCKGKDPVLNCREGRCPRRLVKGEDIEEAVWSHVKELLSNPEQLIAQFKNLAQLDSKGSSRQQAEVNKIEMAFRTLK
ncbi:MAG: recombinase family protein [Blastocatellia bacterium]|nr:recombinase family protein [Blastocatellia bacterium]